MDVVIPKRKVIAWARIIPLLAIGMLATGCASRGTPEDNGFVYQSFKSDTAVSDTIRLRPIEIQSGELHLNPDNLLVSSSVLRVSPLELTKIERVGSLYVLAKRVTMIATFRHDGDDKRKAFATRNGAYPGYRFERVLEYRNWEDAASDFPSIPLELLKKNGRKTANGLEIVKWRTDYYFVMSPDKTAYKIIMANTKILDHQRPVPDNGPLDNPDPYYGAVTFRYPRTDTERVFTTSIVFKLANQSDRRVYSGGQQSSGWLPLPGNNKRGPYNIYFSLVYASNSHSVFDLGSGIERLITKFIGG